MVSAGLGRDHKTRYYYCGVSPEPSLVPHVHRVLSAAGHVGALGAGPRGGGGVSRLHGRGQGPGRPRGPHPGVLLRAGAAHVLHERGEGVARVDHQGGHDGAAGRGGHPQVRAAGGGGFKRWGTGGRGLGRGPRWRELLQCPGPRQCAEP